MLLPHHMPGAPETWPWLLEMPRLSPKGPRWMGWGAAGAEEALQHLFEACLGTLNSCTDSTPSHLNASGICP